MKGSTHIIYGDGKGKTTSAVGCAVRAKGSGMNVVFVSLMKDGTSNENKLLEKCGIVLFHCDKHYGFTFEMTDEEKAEITACHNKILSDAYELAQQGKADMLVVDEFFCAYEFGLCDKALAEKIVFERPYDTELILTGHEVDKKFLDAADYISRIDNERHPFEKGVPARIGVEF